MSTVVILPGGFHPYHAGHFALYQSAKKAFPGADVYVAATNDMSERPFPFELKEKLAKLAGVEPGHFVQVKSPFQSKEITQHYDPNKDVLVFVRSEKDRNESPKPGGTKKDGTPAYFQPWTGKNLQPFAKHAYFAYLPTVEFGPGITSATQIRKAWPTLDDRRKTALVMSLYPAAQKNPKLAQTVVGMFDQVMGGGQSVQEGSEQKFNVTYDVYGSNKEKPLYTKTQAVRANSEQEAINILRKLVGGANHRIEGVQEGWKQKLGAAALAGAMAAPAGGIMLNPNRIIDASGRSAANPYGNVDSMGNPIRKPAVKPEDDAWAKIEKRKAQDKLKEEEKKKEDDLFISADPESEQLLRYAQQHYPSAPSKQQAFIKFVQRSLKHSEDEDKEQDHEILRIKDELDKIKKMIQKSQVTESTDYLEEK